MNKLNIAVVSISNARETPSSASVEFSTVVYIQSICTMYTTIIDQHLRTPVENPCRDGISLEQSLPPFLSFSFLSLS